MQALHQTINYVQSLLSDLFFNLTALLNQRLSEYQWLKLEINLLSDILNDNRLKVKILFGNSDSKERHSLQILSTLM